MEADWSVELALEDPVVVVPWRSDPQDHEGSQLRFVDLRQNPSGIDTIAEAQEEPALRNALLALNGSNSIWSTAKCGLWESHPQSSQRSEQGFDPAGIDPDEMDATPEEALFSAGCYLDLIPADTDISALNAPLGARFAVMEARIRSLAQRLRPLQLRCVRADFILRHAEIFGHSSFAVTWFVTACSAELAAARQRRAEALRLMLPTVFDAVSPEERYNDRSTGE
jgi:hypothetical protein